MEPPNYYDRVERWANSERYAHEIGGLLSRFGLPAGADLLDIGCGAGVAIRFASRRGFWAVGVDSSPIWESRYPIRPAVRADATRLPFRNASFDGVLLFHVLAHLADPEVCLAEIHRVLRSGGRIAISTPNAEYLDALKASVTSTYYVADPTVRRHLTAAQVQRLLSTAGFLVRDASTFDPTPHAAPSPIPLGERLFFVAERK
jgi:ubiquinone/menaquinone biosynthesis C-methylase UbiE